MPAGRPKRQRPPWVTAVWPGRVTATVIGSRRGRYSAAIGSLFNRPSGLNAVCSFSA